MHVQVNSSGERVDRFGRNDTEALRAVDELHEYGVAVRFANQPVLTRWMLTSAYLQRWRLA
jgi:DNA invertase Pin-like site-specific DNA recombinase